KEDGFSMRLADLGWQRWDRLGELYPSARFGAHIGPELGLVIIPIHFDDIKPAEDARTAAFLAMCGCSNAAQALGAARRTRVSGLDAVECSFDKIIQTGTMHYQLCIVHRDDADYCISVWSSKSSEQAAQALGDVLGRAAFQAGLRPPGAAVPPPGEWVRVARFYNFAGLHLFNARQFMESEPCFLKA